MEKKPGSSGLYEPLPKSLGGRNARPVAAALGALLPFPPGARIPAEDSLNSSIRNRALLLDGDVPVKKEKPKNPPRRQRRAAAGKIVIPREEQKYDLYVPLMKLWQDYAAKLVSKESMHTCADRILRMDLHGAPVEVIRSRDPGLVGVSGILVAETANTIIVVVKEDRALTIPKNVSVISVQFRDISVEISLPALQFRASERSARKIKKRHLPML